MPDPRTDLVDRLRGLHRPVDEFAEMYADEDGHDARFPSCPAVQSDDLDDCAGHCVPIQVCSECGYEHDGDTALFRPWPCPTITALAKHQTARYAHLGRLGERTTDG